MGRGQLSSISQISNITQASTLSNKAKLKVPRCCSNKKDASAAIELKPTKKFAQNSFVVRVYTPNSAKKGIKY